MTKCGTVGERATEGTETLSTAPGSHSGKMLPSVIHREQTSKKQKHTNGLRLQISGELSQRCLETNRRVFERQQEKVEAPPLCQQNHVTSVFAAAGDTLVCWIHRNREEEEQCNINQPFNHTEHSY